MFIFIIKKAIISMNVSYFSFYRQYINSPLTSLHQLNKVLKTHVIFIYLITLPYYKFIYLTSLLILLLKYNIFYKSKIFKLCNKLYLYILFVFVLLYLLINSNSYSIDNRYSHIIYYFPINIKVRFYNKKIIINLKYIIALMPEFIIKIILININYLILLKILFMTTQYEYIILLLLPYYKFINQYNNLELSNLNYILFFSLHLLERIIYNIQNIYISFKLKYNTFHFLFFKTKIFMSIIITFMSNIWHDIYDISFILSSRNIIIKTFYM